jgi:hypothetical protein
LLIVLRMTYNALGDVRLNSQLGQARAACAGQVMQREGTNAPLLEALRALGQSPGE